MASGPYSYGLYVLDAKTGKTLRKLASIPYSVRTAWSPDGKRIAYTNAQGQVTVMSAVGSSKQPLAPGGSPAWSPDGKQIVYVGPKGLGIMGADGSGKRLLLKCAGCGSPDWQPLP